MSLYELAHLDNIAILTDPAGFRVRIMVSAPGGAAVEFWGMAADIGLTIDPDTGQAVAGRRAHCTIPTDGLIAAFGKIPEGLADGPPWIAEIQLPGEIPSARRFKIVERARDRLGCVVLFLEEIQTWP